MIKCNNIENFSYEGFKIKQDKIVYKRRDGAGNFIGSVIMPTNYYPLHDDNIDIFYDHNTELITDNNVKTLIDRIPYKVGHCYHNSENIFTLLKKNGYDVKMYCGWMFQGVAVGSNTLPIHHSWVVIDDKHIIDLSNDYMFMIKYIEHQYGAEKTKRITPTQWRTEFANARRYIVKNNIKNSDRCYLGIASGNIYVGCEAASADEGISIYQELRRQFPTHETDRNINMMNVNPTQAMLIDKGLM